MKAKKSYLTGFFPLLGAAVLLLLWLFGQLILEQKKEEEPVFLTASLPQGEITEELYASMQDFPGLLSIWPVLSVQVQLEIGDYQTSASLLGVDLSSYPLELLSSAGEKAFGTKPLLVVGADLLSGLTDQSGAPITDRQKRILTEQLSDLSVNLSLLSGEESSESLSALSGSQGEFLGISSGTSLYMDQDQMRDWLQSMQTTAPYTGVCIEIRGRTNAESALEALTKAGFSAEFLRSEVWNSDTAQGDS